MFTEESLAHLAANLLFDRVNPRQFCVAVFLDAMAVAAISHHLTCPDAFVAIDLPEHRRATHHLCRADIVAPENFETLLLTDYSAHEANVEHDYF